jgi:hypothetical protein
MPGPHSVDAPSFSEESSVSFADFLHEFEALATANGLTDLQRLEVIFQYISPSLRKFWKTVDGYDHSDWAIFCVALVGMYPDTSAAARFTKRALHSFIHDSRRCCMRNEEDVMRYYRQYLKLTNPLRAARKLSDEARNAKFFKGFHREDREILSSRIFAMRPNHPEDTPYELDNVFKAARSYFSNAQFYRPMQRRLRDDNGYDDEYDSDSGSDSDSDYEPRDSRRTRDSR